MGRDRCHKITKSKNILLSSFDTILNFIFEKDENSNIQPPRHDSISPASMDSSIQDDENRVAKSKFFLFLLSVSPFSNKGL